MSPSILPLFPSSSRVPRSAILNLMPDRRREQTTAQNGGHSPHPAPFPFQRSRDILDQPLYRFRIGAAHLP